MIKYIYCEDFNIVKKEVNYDTSFSILPFNTSSLISSLNIVDIFNPRTNFIIKMDEINIADINFVHNSIFHDDKNIYFLLPEEPQRKKLDFFTINNFDYIKISNDDTSSYDFLLDYVVKNNIGIDSILLTKIVNSYSDIDTCINEINKIASFAYPDIIKATHFNQMGTKTEDVNIFNLVEYYLLSNNEKALLLYEELIACGYSEIALLETLYKQVRLLLQVNSLKNNSVSSMNSVLKIHEYRIKSSIKLLNATSKSSLYKFLRNIAYIDFKYKNGIGELENIKYELLII